MKEAKTIYVRWSGRFNDKGKAEGLELCIDREVHQLSDAQALAVAKKIIEALL